MEDLNKDLDIFLLPEGEEDAEFRTKEPKSRHNAFQADYGDALLAKANVVGITHGYLTPEGHPASLLVFEFRFISMQKSRRFTSCQITVQFEDSDGDVELCPEVHKIAPDGVFALHKTSTQKHVKLSANAGLNVGSGPASANAGVAWETSEVQKSHNWTRLMGTRKELGNADKDDAVIWSMDENEATKGGVPSFLRTAVLLRREADVPFSYLIKIRARADFRVADVASDLRSLLGKKKVDRVAPIKIDSDANLKLVRAATENPTDVDLTQLDGLDIGEFAQVTLITLV